MSTQGKSICVILNEGEWHKLTHPVYQLKKHGSNQIIYKLVMSAFYAKLLIQFLQRWVPWKVIHC